MSQSTAAAAATPAPASNGDVPTGTTPSPVAPVTVNVNPNGSPGSGRHAGSAGNVDHLLRLDGWSTASELKAAAEKWRLGCVRRHDAYLQHAATLEQGIKRTSNWPWALDRLTTARRLSRPLRQCAAAEMDQARRISRTVNELIRLKDAPKVRTQGRGLDLTK